MGRTLQSVTHPVRRILTGANRGTGRHSEADPIFSIAVQKNGWRKCQPFLNIRFRPKARNATRLLLFFLLLFLLRVALFADLPRFLRLHAALVFAFLAGGLGLFAARFGANEADATEHREGADDCSHRLHAFFLIFWPG